jgi:hypothetical protein
MKKKIKELEGKVSDLQGEIRGLKNTLKKVLKNESVQNQSKDES